MTVQRDTLRLTVRITIAAVVLLLLLGFSWGGERWNRTEGQKFTTWLETHGASPWTFRRKHHELARVFGKHWPTPRRWSEEWLRREVNRAWPQADEWVRIGICESGRNPPNWQHNSGTYQGALGFYHGSWDAFRPAHFPSEAYDATPWQQMYVAERIYDRYGLTGWGCRNAA